MFSSFSLSSHTHKAPSHFFLPLLHLCCHSCVFEAAAESLPLGVSFRKSKPNSPFLECCYHRSAFSTLFLSLPTHIDLFPSSSTPFLGLITYLFFFDFISSYRHLFNPTCLFLINYVRRRRATKGIAHSQFIRSRFVLAKAKLSYIVATGGKSNLPFKRGVCMHVCMYV